MRFGVVALALCGCNQIFGLPQTKANLNLDAPYFDAPIDAPFACPTNGEAPAFSRVLHQIAQSCLDYTVDVQLGRAAAYCYEPATGIAEGPADGPLVRVAAIADFDTQHFDFARLSPEGDELFVRNWDSNTAIGHIRAYRRNADNGFTSTYEVTVQGYVIDSFVRFSPPTPGPSRRMLLRNNGQLLEIEFDTSGAGTVVDANADANLGAFMPTQQAPSLTADGLHVIFPGSTATITQSIMYSDRTSLGARFGAAIPIAGVPATVNDPFMTVDCGRIYFSGLQSVLWVQRS